MNREITSTSTVEKSTAEFNGWELNFTKNSESEGKVTISVYGKKGDNSVTANLSDNGSTSITFRNETNIALAEAILEEIEEMK